MHLCPEPPLASSLPTAWFNQLHLGMLVRKTGSSIHTHTLAHSHTHTHTCTLSHTCMCSFALTKMPTARLAVLTDQFVRGTFEVTGPAALKLTRQAIYGGPVTITGAAAIS